MELVLQMLPDLQGQATSKCLAPEAAASIQKVEKASGGLSYKNMWHGPDSLLLVRRTRNDRSPPGYSIHNYGVAVDLDLSILRQRSFPYKELIRIMAKFGWYCRRQDGIQDAPGSDHFNYLGEKEEADHYLKVTTQDPESWRHLEEQFMFEHHEADFMIPPSDVQKLLAKIGFYTGPLNGKVDDAITREAIMAFQRAWGLHENGADMVLRRALIFVSAEKVFV